MPRADWVRNDDPEFVPICADYVRSPDWTRMVIRRGPYECWPFVPGKRNLEGYGQVYLAGRTRKATWVLMIATTGHLIPSGEEVDHLCSYSPCVNIHHLEQTTRRENLLRQMENQGRLVRTNDGRFLCGAGHDYTAHVLARNNYRCPHCESARATGYYLLRRQAATLLGLTMRQYTRRYGQSAQVAQRLISEAGGPHGATA